MINDYYYIGLKGPLEPRSFYLAALDLMAERQRKRESQNHLKGCHYCLISLSGLWEFLSFFPRLYNVVGGIKTWSFHPIAFSLRSK